MTLGIPFLATLCEVHHFLKSSHQT
jgi:hypothetical protein